uniref:Uncharacterized protein n=1 Tax=Anguilla anguilla TaxID=7936 RepID=A0A0E9TM59_ANGAN
MQLYSCRPCLESFTTFSRFNRCPAFCESQSESKNQLAQLSLTFHCLQ